MKIGIVILNYNSYADTIKLVGELQKQTVASELVIVVVDNHSPNESFEELKPLEQKWNNVVILQTEANLGYAKGNNYGLLYLEKHIAPDYVAVLNNDIVLPCDCLENLMSEYERLDNPGLIAPKQVMLDGKIYVGGPINSFWDDFKNLFFLYRYMNKKKEKKDDRLLASGVLKVEIVLGSFIFTSLECFKQIGYFYPNTFLFVEERFVAHRVKELGYQNYVLLEQSYLHIHSKTINSVFSQVQKYKMQYEGWLEFTRKCRVYGQLKAILLRPFIIYSLLEIRLVYKLLFKLKKNKK